VFANIYLSYIEENWCHFLLSWTKQIPTSNDSKYRKKTFNQQLITIIMNGWHRPNNYWYCLKLNLVKQFLIVLF